MTEEKLFKIKPYHKYNSLLVQLILSEYFACCRELQVIKDHPDKGRAGLEKMTGTTHPQKQSFPWSTNQGLLYNLRYYIESFQENDEIAEIAPLLEWVIRTWHQAAESQKKSENNWPEIAILLNEFQQYIPPLIALFSRDENVIYFLLRQHTEIQKYFGEEWLSHQLFIHYPEGWGEIKKFLLQRYAKRHFDHLLPLIQVKISEIEAVKKG